MWGGFWSILYGCGVTTQSLTKPEFLVISLTALLQSIRFTFGGSFGLGPKDPPVTRTELLVSVRLGRPTGTPLGQRSTHITPLEKASPTH